MAAAQTPGAVLKTLMDEYQLNPTQLAKEIKLSQSAVRQIVIGQTKITAPSALRLAKYFGNTPDYWINLQTLNDLSEASKDKELTAILKTIPKAKKPVPKKTAAPVFPQKKPAKAGTKPPRKTTAKK
jgi:addiction module HigA family antidote